MDTDNAAYREVGNEYAAHVAEGEAREAIGKARERLGRTDAETEEAEA
jgi:hypothetical protein